MNAADANRNSLLVLNNYIALIHEASIKGVEPEPAETNT